MMRRRLIWPQAEEAGGWSPPGWMTADTDQVGLQYDGVIQTGATDGENFEACFLVRDLDNLTEATIIFGTAGNRHRIRWTATQEFGVRLDNTGGTTLVDWESDDPLDPTGTHLIHVEAVLDGTPTMVVSTFDVSGGSWSTVAGSFSTGPTQGNIDNARAIAGNDMGVWVAHNGADDCYEFEFVYAWVNLSNATPQGRDAFATGGVLVDPETVGTPTMLFMAPASGVATNLGAGSDFTIHGTFVDV